MPILTLIFIGLVAGIGSGIFGIGGGVIIVPLLVLLLKLAQQTAVATSLVALLLPVGILGVWTYYQAGSLDRNHITFGLWIALGIFVGALIGARIALPIPEIYLRRAFAILMIALGLRLWLR